MQAKKSKTAIADKVFTLEENPQPLNLKHVSGCANPK